jgi:hypothetical protein
MDFLTASRRLPPDSSELFRRNRHQCRQEHRHPDKECARTLKHNGQSGESAQRQRQPAGGEIPADRLGQPASPAKWPWTQRCPLPSIRPLIFGEPTSPASEACIPRMLTWARMPRLRKSFSCAVRLRLNIVLKNSRLRTSGACMLDLW